MKRAEPEWDQPFVLSKLLNHQRSFGTAWGKMPSKEILRLLAGFRRFRMRYFDPDSSFYRRLQGGQTPKSLVIACSDSRVDPAILTDASPGEMFVVRNVANLVPPFESGGTYHGVSAAIEFAVVNLRVENVIILGHRQCGGIRSLMQNENPTQGSFVGQWMQIAAPAREKVLREKVLRENETENASETEDRLCRQCELESIAISLDNLRTFPFVQAAMQERRLSLHGAYFDLESGELYEFDHESRLFNSLQFD